MDRHSKSIKRVVLIDIGKKTKSKENGGNKASTPTHNQVKNFLWEMEKRQNFKTFEIFYFISEQEIEI